MRLLNVSALGSVLGQRRRRWLPSRRGRRDDWRGGRWSTRDHRVQVQLRDAHESRRVHRREHHRERLRRRTVRVRDDDARSQHAVAVWLREGAPVTAGDGRGLAACLSSLATRSSTPGKDPDDRRRQYWRGMVAVHGGRLSESSGQRKAPACSTGQPQPRVSQTLTKFST